MKPDLQQEAKLRWPEGWSRTLIELRRPAPQWRQSLDYYRSKLVRELTLMGATSVLLTHAPPSQERMDPGAAVWFSMVREDYSWQTLLGLGPAPRLEEINDVFQQKAKAVHPDRADGGDIELFKRLVEAREKAKAWIAGTHADRHEYVLALDRYATVRANLAGLWRALVSFRSLQKLGMPSILERVLDKAFRTALPMRASGDAPLQATGGQDVDRKSA